MARDVANYTNELAHLRLYGQASNELESYESVVYWTDVQLMTILERTIDNREVGLIPNSIQSTTGYLDFRMSNRYHWWLDSLNMDFTGTDATPTFDSATQTLTFATQQLTEITIHAPFFNMTRALAELWEAKAAQRYNLIRIKGGANQLFMEQEYEHCRERALYYRNRLGKRFRLRKSW
jgi:hypothetical protein